MATFYGSDTACTTDLPLIDLQITNPSTLIAQRLIRRLLTPRGGLASVGDDANFGWDVRQYLNAAMTAAAKDKAQREIQSECLKEDQIASATCTVSLVNGTLTIAISAVAATGPFDLTLNVNQLTVDAVFSF
jgi:hypothetical protein